MCSLLISPCLPPLLGDLSVSGYLWHFRMCVCVWLWGGVWRLQTDPLSPLSSPRLSVCGSVVKSMASCCSGCVLLLFLSLWACCCQIKPSPAPSDASPLKCVWSNTLTVYLPISLPASSLLAHLSISQTGCLFLQPPPYLLSRLSPYYLQNKLSTFGWVMQLFWAVPSTP